MSPKDIYLYHWSSWARCWVVQFLPLIWLCEDSTSTSLEQHCLNWTFWFSSMPNYGRSCWEQLSVEMLLPNIWEESSLEWYDCCSFVIESHLVDLVTYESNYYLTFVFLFPFGLHKTISGCFYFLGTIGLTLPKDFITQKENNLVQSTHQGWCGSDAFEPSHYSECALVGNKEN